MVAFEIEIETEAFEYLSFVSHSQVIIVDLELQESDYTLNMSLVANVYCAFKHKLTILCQHDCNLIQYHSTLTMGLVITHSIESKLKNSVSTCQKSEF